MRAGPRNLITDVSGLQVGNAQDDALKSGVTCLAGAQPFRASVDVRGGAPGTRETDLLAPDKTVEAVDALVLSGGSAFGLDAAAGVVDAMREAGRGFAVGDVRVPIVPAAILFDLLNGGDKAWTENPYRVLGRAALDAAAREFEIGSTGVGTGALTARLKGGLGSASAVLPSGVTVGALVGVNPVGCVTPPGDRHFWAGLFEEEDEFGGAGPVSRRPAPLGLADTKLAGMADASTVIGIVATDAPLTKTDLKRLAVMTHDGFARAIVPSHTPHDGDLVFSVSTSPDATGVSPVEMAEIGHAAATAMARAIARGVFAATPSPDDVRPTWSLIG